MRLPISGQPSRKANRHGQKELLAAGATKANEKLPKRVRVSLTWCKGCREGRINMTLVSGDGQALQQLQLAENPVPATFVCEMLEINPGSV